MNVKFISIVLTGTAIALTTITLNVTKSVSQQTPEQKVTLVCANSVTPPTTFIYTQGEVLLKPVFTWYSEYLLPNQSAAQLCQTVAQKLQTKYEQGQKFFLAYEQANTKDQWKVCLVSKKEDKCSSPNSEELFSLNYDAKYNAPKCVLENKEPTSCPSAPPPTRGQVFSSPGGRYTPTWWFFF